MTHLEAWADFYRWIKRQHEVWINLPRTEKQYFYKTEKAARDGKLGNSRIEAVLKRYAPERYEFKSIVIIHDEKGPG